jgi:hypothetical protein
MELYNPALGILLLAVLLASAVILMLAFVLSFNGNERLAWRIVKAWGVGAAVYGAVLLVTAMQPRTSAMKTALPYCDDDLCMTVVNVSQTPVRDGIRERFNVRLSSRANHGTRSAKGAEVYLADDRNRKFRLLDTSPVPFDVDVDPGQSVDTALTFDVPSAARKLYFEVRMERITYASFIVGNSHAPWQPLLKLAVN